MTTSSEATHYIRCRHCVGARSCRNYTMKCIPLSVTKSGKTKILLFGERDWARGCEKQSIRYISGLKIHKLKEGKST